jgi:hypothetical protein
MTAVMGAVAHAPCHTSSGHGGKPDKMPCCHCDECTLPGCAAGCAFQGSTFAAAISVTAAPMLADSQPLGAASSDVVSPDPSPPLRPPIA